MGKDAENKKINAIALLSEMAAEEKEAEEARIYVATKEMQRPRVYYITVVVVCMLYVAISLGLSFGIVYVFNLFRHTAIIFVSVFILFFVCYLRIICIFIVKCYQHYASEERRRKCLCKPTCSEYAIAVLKKYPIVIALHKIRVRLYKTCKNSYKIDLP